MGFSPMRILSCFLGGSVFLLFLEVHGLQHVLLIMYTVFCSHGCFRQFLPFQTFMLRICLGGSVPAKKRGSDSLAPSILSFSLYPVLYQPSNYLSQFYLTGVNVLMVVLPAVASVARHGLGAFCSVVLALGKILLRPGRPGIRPRGLECAYEAIHEVMAPGDEAP